MRKILELLLEKGSFFTSAIEFDSYDGDVDGKEIKKSIQKALKKHTIEIIDYDFEVNNTVLVLSYTRNGKELSMRVNGLFKQYILDNFTHNGISETVYDDFINKVDVKYKIDDSYILAFLEWFHN